MSVCVCVCVCGRLYNYIDTIYMYAYIYMHCYIVYVVCTANCATNNYYLTATAEIMLCLCSNVYLKDCIIA